MHTAQLLIALFALVAMTGAQQMNDKRFVRQPGMPIVKTPPGTVAFKRSSSLDTDHQGDMARRIVLEPGMHPMVMPYGAVSHKRDSHIFKGDDGSTLKVQSKPLSLTVATGKYNQRSMPLELDSQTLASMPEEEQEKYSRRYILEGQAAPLPSGPGHVTPLKREEDTMERRYILQGPNGQTLRPKPVGAGMVTAMKRADEMRVGFKTPGRPILPRQDYQVGVHPLT